MSIMLLCSWFKKNDQSSIWARTKPYSWGSNVGERPEVTWPEVLLTGSDPDRKSRDRKRPYRKYVMRMRNRKLRNIRP